MKIKDVTLKEAAPKKVPPQPTLNGKPSTGPKGQAWLQKYGATHNPDGTPKAVDAMAGADAGNQQTSNYTGNVQKSAEPEPAAPAAPPEPAGDQTAGGKTNADFLPGVAGGATPTSTTPPPQSNALGVQAQSGAAFGQAAPTPDKPMGQAAQPAPAPAAAPVKTAQDFASQPQVNPDTGLSTKPVAVAGTSNVVSGSDDEMAWRSKQTGIVDVTKYPGPGNWDPKTGRTKQDPNKPGFFDKFFGKKPAPAAPVQQAQPVVPAGFAESNSDLDRIRKLSGLR